MPDLVRAGRMTKKNYLFVCLNVEPAHVIDWLVGWFIVSYDSAIKQKQY